jgi:hypothetical protein
MGFRVGGKHEEVLYKKTVYMLLMLGIHQPSPRPGDALQGVLSHQQKRQSAPSLQGTQPLLMC